MFGLPAAQDGSRRYDELCARVGAAAGGLHSFHAQLVDLVATGLADEQLRGAGIRSAAHWVAWRAGVSGTIARQIVAVATRVDELPETMAAFRTGRIGLDHARLIAKHVPSSYEASVATMAQEATVAHLAKILPGYRFDDDDNKPDRPAPEPPTDKVTIRTGADGAIDVRAQLVGPSAHRFAAALAAARDDLYAERKKASAEGEEPAPVSAREAFLELGETYLDRGQADHPHSDRYDIQVHLQAGPTGTLELRTQDGRFLPDGPRRQILCEARLRALVHDKLTPIGSGRATRTPTRAMRRAVIHRQHGQCAVPGCPAIHRLEIHHLWHWEDGGPTESWNLVALCSRHHHLHHAGVLRIAGNPDKPADHPRALTFRDARGNVLPPAPSPTTPAGTERHTTRYKASMCDRLDPHWVHFNELHPPGRAA